MLPSIVETALQLSSSSESGIVCFEKFEYKTGPISVLSSSTLYNTFLNITDHEKRIPEGVSYCLYVSSRDLEQHVYYSHASPESIVAPRAFWESILIPSFRLKLIMRLPHSSHRLMLPETSEESTRLWMY